MEFVWNCRRADCLFSVCGRVCVCSAIKIVSVQRGTVLWCCGRGGPFGLSHAGTTWAHAEEQRAWQLFGSDRHFITLWTGPRRHPNPRHRRPFFPLPSSG
jgi:hypothetical protein